MAAGNVFCGALVRAALAFSTYVSFKITDLSV
jgi:hypothetical protein